MASSAIADPALDTQLQKALSCSRAAKAAIRAKGVLVFMAKQIFCIQGRLSETAKRAGAFENGQTRRDRAGDQKARSFGDLSENSEYDEAKTSRPKSRRKSRSWKRQSKTPPFSTIRSSRPTRSPSATKVRIYNVLDDAEQEFFPSSARPRPTRLPTKFRTTRRSARRSSVPAKATRSPSRRRSAF